MSQPGQGETVRGYAYVRSEAVQAAIRKYEENLREFFSALGIYVSPAGATPRHDLRLSQPVMWIHMSTFCGWRPVGPTALKG